MTKVLLITNTADLTCDYVVSKLRESGADFYRLNTDLIGKDVFFDFDLSRSRYHIRDARMDSVTDVELIEAVYFRRPELPVYDGAGLTWGEKAYVDAENAYVLEGLYKLLDRAFWISRVYAIREAENKVYQLRVAKEAGFRVPDALVSNWSGSINDFKRREGDCVIKPMKSGLIRYKDGDKVFFTSRFESEDVSGEMLLNPIYLQNLIEKDVDVRVTVVGDKVFATAIHSQDHADSAVDWRRGGCIPRHTRCCLPTDVGRMCADLVRRLGLKFGAIDLVRDTEGGYVFLEINPNGQWAWIENQTGYDISGEIVKLLIDH